MTRKKVEEFTGIVKPEKGMKLLVEVGCYACLTRAMVKIDPHAPSNTFPCAKCTAQNNVLLRAFTTPYIRTVVDG